MTGHRHATLIAAFCLASCGGGNTASPDPYPPSGPTPSDLISSEAAQRDAEPMRPHGESGDVTVVGTHLYATRNGTWVWNIEYHGRFKTCSLGMGGGCGDETQANVLIDATTGTWVSTTTGSNNPWGAA